MKIGALDVGSPDLVDGGVPGDDDDVKSGGLREAITR